MADVSFTQKYGERVVLEAEKNLYDRIDSEMRMARAASAAQKAEARQARIDKGETVKDTVNISEAARAIADGYSDDVPDPNSAPSVSMSAITAYGTKITLEGRSLSSGSFIMGGLRENSPLQAGMFKMNQGSMSGPNAAMEYTLSFVGNQGKVESYKLDGNTLFTVQEDGTIRKAPVTGDKRALSGSEGQDILIGLEDGSILDGGAGDDIIFNVGLNSTVTGGDGDDAITSMGEDTMLDGGAGDDMLTLLQDTLRPQDYAGIKESEGDAPDKRSADYRVRGAQSMKVHGGDGNDSIVAKTELFESTIDGGTGSDEVIIGNATATEISLGDGSDSLLANNLVYSSIAGGNGNDSIEVNDIWHSSIDGGDGDDRIRGRDAHSSAIGGGAGNDVIIFRDLVNSTMGGGDGDDVLAVTRKSVNSGISGGDGNDFIYVSHAVNSTIEGGEGNDEIIVARASNTKIMGNNGNDILRVGTAEQESVIDGGNGIDEMSIILHSKDSSVLTNEEDAELVTGKEAEELMKKLVEAPAE